MRDRQRERGIPDALVSEVIADGLITDQLDSRSLHLSDHVIVIRNTRDRVGITTFRHPLLGEWRADRSSAHTSTAKILDTAYFFFQVCSVFYLLNCAVADGDVLIRMCTLIRKAKFAFMEESSIKGKVVQSLVSGFRF